MSLDRNYKVEIDLFSGAIKSDAISLFTTDKDIFTMKVKLKLPDKTYVTNTDLLKYTTTLYVIKPDNNYVEQVSSGAISGEDALGFTLPAKFNDQQGIYKGEFKIVEGSDEIGTASFTYSVKFPAREGLAQEASIEIMSLNGKNKSPFDACNERIDEVLETTIGDVRFNGKEMTVLTANGEVKNTIFLNKMVAPETEVGKGIKKNRKGVLVVDEKYINDIVEKAIKKVIKELDK